jgi:hypothetical protein
MNVRSFATSLTLLRYKTDYKFKNGQNVAVLYFPCVTLGLTHATGSVTFLPSQWVDTTFCRVHTRPFRNVH